jgi:hypothetical protein
MLDRKTPMNFGVTYRGWTGMELAGHSLYGSDLGASLTFVLNPKEQRALSG